jgi:ribosomal protein S18 acetylase RimI-like enzyme
MHRMDSSPPAVALVPFEPARTDELIRLWRAAFEHGVGIVDPHPFSAHRAYLEREVLPGHAVWMALLDERLAGFVAASADSVAQLHVRVDLHRRGIGSLLLDHAKARSAGSLWLYTFARNRIARAFYARQGFVEVEHGFEPTWQLDDVKLEWKTPA